MTRLGVLCAALFVLLGLLADSLQAEFVFTKIADSETTAGLDPSNALAQLDGDQVYFRSGGFFTTQIDVGNGGDVTTIVAPGNGINRIRDFSADGGEIAFLADDRILATNNGSLETIWDLNVPLPGAPARPSSAFPIAGKPTLRNGVVAFRGGHASTTPGPGSLHDGIYTRPLGGGAIEVVADRNTEIPGAENGETFPTFGIYQLNQFGGFGDNCGECGAQIDDQGNVMFAGFTAANADAAPSGGYVREAATGEVRQFSTSVQGFSGLGNGFDIDGGLISAAFVGPPGESFLRGATLSAVDGSGVTVPYGVGSAAPGAEESFTRILNTVTVDDGNLAFLSQLPGDRYGLFAEVGDELHRVLDDGMLLDGKAIMPGTAFTSNLLLSAGGFDGSSIAFSVRFADATSAIYRADFLDSPPPGSSPANPILPPPVLPPRFGDICAIDNCIVIVIASQTNQGNPETPIWIDPEVAIGYDYEVVEGPNVATITMPEGFGDDEYELQVLNEVTQDYESVATLNALQPFDVTSLFAGGLSSFRVLGIEASAMVDPTDPLGFPTGLTFVSAGAVAVTMTALVPEPTTALMALAATLLAGTRRRR